MDQMFWESYSFDSDLNFDLTYVKNLSLIFTNASSFTGNISNWDVSRVEDMFHTFSNATSFNSDISGWNTSAVKSLWGTFENTALFNQPLSSWDTSSVEDFESVCFCAHSSTINNCWEALVSQHVVFMLYFTQCFQGAVNFNQPLDSWNVSTAKIMSKMFQDARSFSQASMGAPLICLFGNLTRAQSSK